MNESMNEWMDEWQYKEVFVTKGKKVILHGKLTMKIAWISQSIWATTYQQCVAVLKKQKTAA